MQEAILRFRYPAEIAKAIAGALSPEISPNADDVPKTRASVERAGDEIVVRLAADDLSALRAAVNSYLRWVDAAERATRAAR